MNILEYDYIKSVFNKKIFENSRKDLIEKLSKYPSRYIGLFRPTKPFTKIIQNITQSHEIKFGDAFEILIRLCFEESGYNSLNRTLKLKNGDTVNFDQLFSKDNSIVFIEQKLRDDHDSTKKRGQIENFEKKLNYLIEMGYDNIRSYIYFIDDSLNKNQKYYLEQIEKLRDFYNVHIELCYGNQLFEQENILHLWEHEIIDFLRTWRNDLPDLPEINFDLTYTETFEEIKDLSPSVFRSLFDNDEIINIIFPIIFPERKTLYLLLGHFKDISESNSKNSTLYAKLHSKLEIILN
jgi:hypothetical protein